MKFIRTALLSLVLITPALADPASTLVIDAATGQVLHQNNAGASWFPASLTKMMTAYVTLSAEKEGRLKFDQPMRVSLKAAKQAPSKMGFKPNSLLTVDNALKIIMVKSANDVSMTIAEGVSGSLEAFVKEMNLHAKSLGMTATNFTNANGLPSAAQKTSARDMAILARALLVEFPEHRDLWDIPSLTYNGKNIRNTNHLIGRFPNVIGMKTGFICASGFNMVAAATQNGRTLITVVLGSHTARDRAVTAANLLATHFNARGTGRDLYSIGNEGGAAPDIRSKVCIRRAKGQLPVAETGEFFDNEQPLIDSGQSAHSFFLQEQMRKEKVQTGGPLHAYTPHREAEPIFLGAKQGVALPVLGALVVAKALAPKKAIPPKREGKPLDKKQKEKVMKQLIAAKKKPS